MKSRKIEAAKAETNDAYVTVAYRQVPLDELTPHPDAERYPTDQADRSFLWASLAERGQQQPIIIVENDAGGYWILDGVGRFEFAQTQCWPTLDCRIVQPCDVSNAVNDANAAGRRRSVGSQLLGYLAGHEDQIVRAYESMSEPNGTRDPLGKLHGKRVASEASDWTGEAIAKRLGVSDKDAKLACALVRSIKLGVDPDGNELDAEGVEALNAVYRSVLVGATPIRKWKAAKAGKSVQVGGKAATNWGNVADRLAASIGPVFEQWPAIEWPVELCSACEKRIDYAMRKMPEFLRMCLIDVIPETWGDHDLKALRKQIDERLRASKAAK